MSDRGGIGRFNLGKVVDQAVNKLSNMSKGKDTPPTPRAKARVPNLDLQGMLAAAKKGRRKETPPTSQSEPSSQSGGTQSRSHAMERYAEAKFLDDPEIGEGAGSGEVSLDNDRGSGEEPTIGEVFTPPTTTTTTTTTTTQPASTTAEAPPVRAVLMEIQEVKERRFIPAGEHRHQPAKTAKDMGEPESKVELPDVDVIPEIKTARPKDVGTPRKHARNISDQRGRKKDEAADKPKLFKPTIKTHRRVATDLSAPKEVTIGNRTPRTPSETKKTKPLPVPPTPRTPRKPLPEPPSHLSSEKPQDPKS